MISIPKKATTVILLREKTEEVEVFLLKRHEKSSFMGGNFVYPGGRVDLEDSRPETYALCSGVSPEEAHRILGSSVPIEEGLSYWVAGIRELFEEAGVLLAYDQSGSFLLSQDPVDCERSVRYRKSLHKGKLTFVQMAQDEKLLFAVDQLRYYAHWITPEATPQRFDTRFFIARHPTGQEASHDQRETTAGIWITPRAALERNLQGEMILSPPTLKTMEDLSQFPCLNDLFRSLQNKVIQPVLPISNKVAGQTFLVFPWDPEYHLFKRGEIPVSLDHGRPSQPGDRSTRLLFRDGHWHLYCRTQ